MAYTDNPYGSDMNWWDQPGQDASLSDPGRIKKQPVPTYPQMTDPTPINWPGAGQSPDTGGVINQPIYTNSTPSQYPSMPPGTVSAVPSSPFDSESARTNLANEYQAALGRQGRADEINQYIPAVQQYGWDAVKNQIDTSQEAQAFRNKPGAFAGTNVFSDPATAQWEQLLNQTVQRLNAPYQAPSFQPTMDALTQYIQRLNGPAYTPDQLALLQTQQLDPLMAQRDSDEQAIISHFAAQGMGPSSGPVQQALLQNRQKYGALADRSRASVATNAIGLQNQNQANAAGLQAQLPALETNANTYNNQNAVQALGLAGQVPTLAWNRLQGANAGTQGTNPLSALQLLNEFQTQGYKQGADYAQQVQSVLPYLLKIFGL